MWQQWIYRLFLLWFSVGVVLVGFDLLPPYLEWANLVFLVLTGVLAIIYFLKSFGLVKGWIISTIIFVVSMSVEHIGTVYGVFFGNYTYNDDFGLKLFDVPVAIGFAWLMVIGSSHAIVERLFSNKAVLLKILIGAGLSVGMDLILDPVSAVVKEYWIWNQGGLYYDIPFSNFAGWFVLAALFFIVVYLFRSESLDLDWQRRLFTVYVLVTCMFAFIGLLNGLWLASFFSSVILIVLLGMRVFYARS
ncbi:carotenoid biosynthesis protein [Bacillus salinus]|uniref:carotenoid biosynthesis protein n=1 Tax=Bacillus sp. HMF5848 TaxID=2495421 RepID=UPI00163AF13A|nr:carotenoid biosynthesis protein [Bacillus sp. HMF5848]